MPTRFRSCRRTRRAPSSKLTVKVISIAGRSSHGRRLESNRVDIGVFVDNGKNPSAPGFVTFHTLDSENRVYDDKGRIREIGYGAGEVAYTITDWARWIEGRPGSRDGELPAIHRRRAEAPGRRRASRLVTITAELKAARDAQKLAEASRQKAIEEAKKDPTFEAARKKADAEVQAAQKTTQARTKDLDDLLDAKSEPLPLRSLAVRRMRDLARSGDFMMRILERKAGAMSPVAKVLPGGEPSTSSSRSRLRSSPTRPSMSEFGRTLRERHQAQIVQQAFSPGIVADGVSPQLRRHPRESVPKFWRDVLSPRPGRQPSRLDSSGQQRERRSSTASKGSSSRRRTVAADARRDTPSSIASVPARREAPASLSPSSPMSSSRFGMPTIRIASARSNARNEIATRFRDSLAGTDEADRFP